jgi:hypothetical protein
VLRAVRSNAYGRQQAAKQEKESKRFFFEKRSKKLSH